MATHPVPFFPNLVQVRCQWSDTGSRLHECVMWCAGSVVSGYTLAQLNNLAGLFYTYMSQLWGSVGAPNANLVAQIATDWTSNTGLSSNSASSPAAGVGTGELAANTAALVSVTSPVRYRGGHGRIYLPSVAASITTDGRNITTSNLSTMQTHATAIVTGLAAVSTANGGPFTIGTYHFRQSVTPPGPPYKPSQYTATAGLVVQTMLATQRRRLRKAAHH